jgi:hypothetical protein
MFHRHFMHRTLSMGGCGLAMLLCTTLAAAKDTKRVCTPAYVAYKSAVAQQKAGHTHEAREQLESCMQSTCGGLIPKCRALRDKLVSDMPTIVPVVTDDSGAPRVDVQVKVDGVLLTSKLEGTGLPVEAGVHELTFATDAGVFATEKIMIVEGQRNRPVAVSMHTGDASATKAAVATERAAPAEGASPKAATEKTASEDTSHQEPAPAAPSREYSGGGAWALPHSAFPYVVGAVGLAGVGAGALLTFWGNKDNSDLQGSCNPNCKSSSVDHVRTMYIAADISFGVGAVALATATWLFASSRSTEAPVTKAATVFDVHPTPTGGFATVSGAF